MRRARVLFSPCQATRNLWFLEVSAAPITLVFRLVVSLGLVRVGLKCSTTRKPCKHARARGGGAQRREPNFIRVQRLLPKYNREVLESTFYVTYMYVQYKILYYVCMNRMYNEIHIQHITTSLNNRRNFVMHTHRNVLVVSIVIV